MNNSKTIGKVGGFNICFRKEALTSHAGIVLVQEMCERLEIGQLIDQELRVKQRERGYSDSEHVLAICWNLITGGSCLSDIEALRGDPGTQILLGLKAMPAAWTIAEFLRKFRIDAICDLRRLLRRVALLLRPRQKVLVWTLDLDASIYEQCSRAKEGSRKAYNGQIGYHPLFVFCAETSELLFSHLLAGNRHPSAKAIWALEQALLSVPQGAKLQLRADSAFYSWKLIDWLEAHQVIYFITADLGKMLRRLIEGLPQSAWRKTKFYPGIEVAELWYRPKSRDKEYRYVVKRELVTNDEGQTIYKYHAIITNDTHRRPAKALKWHSARSTMENQIKEHKHGFNLEKLPTKKFHANWAYLLIGQLAFNLIAWFKRLVLPQPYHTAMIKTIRHHLFNLAGKIVHTARQSFLMISEDYRYQDVWRFALKQLAKLVT